MAKRDISLGALLIMAGVFTLLLAAMILYVLLK